MSVATVPTSTPCWCNTQGTSILNYWTFSTSVNLESFAKYSQIFTKFSRMTHFHISILIFVDSGISVKSITFTMILYLCFYLLQTKNMCKYMRTSPQKNVLTGHVHVVGNRSCFITFQGHIFWTIQAWRFKGRRSLVILNSSSMTFPGQVISVILALFVNRWRS